MPDTNAGCNQMPLRDSRTIERCVFIYIYYMCGWDSAHRDVEIKFCRLLDPPFWSCLKYPNNFLMDSAPHIHGPQRINPNDFSSSTTMSLTFVHLWSWPLLDHIHLTTSDLNPQSEDVHTVSPTPGRFSKC